MWEVCIGYVFWTLEERVELSKGSASWHAETQGFESLEKFEVFSIGKKQNKTKLWAPRNTKTEDNPQSTFVFPACGSSSHQLSPNWVSPWVKGGFQFSSVQFSSVAQSCPTLCNPMNRSTPGLLSINNSWSSLRLTSIESVVLSSHLILGCPFFSCSQSLPASKSFPMSQLFA